MPSLQLAEVLQPAGVPRAQGVLKTSASFWQSMRQPVNPSNGCSKEWMVLAHVLPCRHSCLPLYKGRVYATCAFIQTVWLHHDEWHAENPCVLLLLLLLLVSQVCLSMVLVQALQRGL